MGRFLAKCCVLGIGLAPSFVPSKAEALPGARPAPKVTLVDVKYADLARAVTAQRGKVVVVEVWAEY